MSPPARYTCEIVFNSAKNVPLADLNDLSSDPYILATLTPSLPGASGPNSDSPPPESISYRTPTVRRSLNPTFNTRWIVSGIPASGFVLTISLRDEDPGNHDDKLGKAVIRFPDPNRDHGEGERELKENWDSGEREYKIHKRHGNLRTRVGTYVAKLVTRGRVKHRVRVLVSVRVLGPAPHLEGDDAERIYTVGPQVFVRHFSPLAAYLTAVHSFIANRLQLTGPVPASLRHRYVGFRPFIKAMFKARGIQGIILNHTLHKQHRAVYRWDANTVWGIIGQDEDAAPQDGDQQADVGKQAVVPKPEQKNEALAKKFLEMTSYGTEGRMFTYVIMLDGEWRFTETGEEFAIQMLSKHTMHADVSLEIAFSGEFFVRRVHTSHHSAEKSDAPDHVHEGANGHSAPPQDNEDDDDASDHPDPSSLPPSAYELVIDNDSGTYRPRKDLLPTLAAFLSRPGNLGALGRVRAMDGFDERLKRWKEQRAEVKKRARGGEKSKGVVRQASVSSASSSGSSSSDEEDRQAAEGAKQDAEAERKKGEQGQEKDALAEDAQRAKDNGDKDEAAQEEERDTTTAEL
ncbi:hypothetical protein C2E23DRAFT_869285 [Lenzites betulinus]|nr:hypothetical protein C2E23DRAFT_869285 [Lenzites betulinus]